MVATAITRDTGRECTVLADEVLMLWAGVHGLLTLSAGPQLPLARRALLRLTDQMVSLAVKPSGLPH